MKPDHRSKLTYVLGGVLPLLIWFCLKNVVNVSDRYLPSIESVASVFVNTELSIFYHLFISFTRILLSYLFAVGASLFVGIFLFQHKLLRELATPFIQSVRAVPAAAILPFFILWFGFSETGRALLLIFGILFNLVIAVMQILENIREKYMIAFRGFQMEIYQIPFLILLPFALENLLPTLRFSLTVIIGLSVIAELLGSQEGLGYLIQSARTTYAFEVVVACALLYGTITVLMDYGLSAIWKKLVPWQGKQ